MPLIFVTVWSSVALPREEIDMSRYFNRYLPNGYPTRITGYRFIKSFIHALKIKPVS